jgi:PAS domain S-box-containing protein
MDKNRNQLIVLIPVGIGLTSFIAGGVVAIYVMFQRGSISGASISNFLLAAFSLSIFFLGVFWFIFGKVRKMVFAIFTENQRVEETYRQIFDGVNDAVFVETLQGEVIDVNARACEMFGWTREEFLTKTIKDMVPQENHALLPEKQDETTISDEPFETVNIRANGEKFPVAVSGRIQTVGDEKRLLVVVRDITEQKRFEADLTAQHQFLTHVIESLTEPFCVINAEDYTVDIANSAALANATLQKGMTCFALTHQQDEPCSSSEHPCPMRAVIEKREAVQFEHIHYDQYGEERYFEVNGYPIFNETGQVTKMIEYSIDITERKKAEEELQKLSRAITQSTASIVITDTSGSIEYVNPAFTAVTGYTREEALGNNPRVLKSGVHDNEFYKDMWDTLNAGEIWRGELCNKNKYGELYWEYASISPVQDTLGKVTNYVAVKENITERKKIISELQKAKEEAEAAAQAKSDFLANMSHEIRTPLNAIYGMTSLMLDTPLNDEQQEFIEIIRGGSDTLLKVINDILDFSKIEAGKMELETQPFYVRSCVEDSLDLLAEKAADKNLDLAYYIENGTPPVVIGDITRLRQILVNLLNNAIKFTSAGEVVINVHSMLVENDQYELKFSVRDTGIGIPAEKIDKLFKSFSQVDSSTTRKYGGTGLGLAISRQLATNMGGTMWVESEEGVGSTFHFTILVDVDPEAKPLYSMDDVPELLGKRVLVVDDNPTNRLILSKQTESWGMEAFTFESGPEALKLIERDEKFDVAILDMQMPEMDGFTLAEKISTKAEYASLPLIILTSIRRDKARSGDIKIAAFLNKPIKTSNLYNILMGVMNVKPQEETAPKKVVEIDSEMAKRHPLRILLAEDNVINQKVALKLLGRLGYRADLAGNGSEVLEALDRQTYDVVFMDIQMPEMDGNEATAHIREDYPKDKQPHIIAMTAHALEGDREKYLGRGMDDYVSKPIRVEELIQAIEIAAQK